MELNAKRYARHLSLEQIGEKGQEQLAKAKVLIVGVGGLGCPAAQYLIAAGVGSIGLIDHDVVDVSNLQRQVLFSEHDIGRKKVEVAKERLVAMNSAVQIHTYDFALNESNTIELFERFDVILDGTDNFETKYLINDASLLTGKPMVYASVYKFEGQLSVFNHLGGPSYRCLFPAFHEREPNSCEEVGVLGVVPGVLGVLQATEVLKIVLELGEVLSGKLKILDLLSMQEQIISFERNETEISAVLREGIRSASIDCASEADELILDVRETHETPRVTGHEVLEIPLRELPHRIHEVPKNKKIKVICQSGMRSAKAVSYLKEKGFESLSNVEGGIKKWV